MRDRVIDFGKRYAAAFTSDDMPGLAAEVAYRFLFAVFPFGIFVAALTAFLAQVLGIRDPTGQMLAALGDNLPASVATQIRPQLEAVIGQTQPGLLTVGAIGALWAATGGTNTIIKAMNRAFDVEDTRGFVEKTVIAVGITILASVGILAAFVTIVGTSVLSEQAARVLGLTGDGLTLLRLARWPVVFLFLIGAVGLLFRLAPAIRPPWRWCFAAGAVFGGGWLAATGLFALYVTNFANYSNTYGALGGVIVLMLWFYLTALVLLAAAEMMAVGLRVADAERLEVLQREPSQSATLDAERSKRAAASADRVLEAYREGRVAPLSPPEPVSQARPRAGREHADGSSPKEWVGAGVVTGVGLAIGATVAWVLGKVTGDDEGSART